MVPGRNDITLSQFGDPISSERLIGGLDPDDRARLGKLMHSTTYTNGQRICDAGLVPARVVFLNEGRARVEYGFEHRDAVPGEVIGFTEVLAGAQASFTVTAVDDCDVSFIDRDDLVNYLRTTPDACFSSLEAVAANLHAAHRRLREHS